MDVLQIPGLIQQLPTFSGADRPDALGVGAWAGGGWWVTGLAGMAALVEAHALDVCGAVL